VRWTNRAEAQFIRCVRAALRHRRIRHARYGAYRRIVDEVQFVSSEIVRRLEGAIDAFAVVWLEGHVLGENPAGIRLEHFDGVTAAATVSRPELDFMNRVHGLAFAEPRVLEEVLSFYRSLELRPWVELPPGAEGVAAGLAEAGARPVDSVAVLFGTPRSLPPPPTVEVRRIGEDAHRSAELLLEGHGVPAEARALDAPGIATTASRDDIGFYAATVDGREAAVGVLALHDRIGYLANASTLPAFRRRGCHSALVARRITDADAMSCDLVASLTSFASASQRTLERAGLRIAYTRTVWRLGEGTE
jgi:ribosomal protein S18 acetylase RimI-like enzyme